MSRLRYEVGFVALRLINEQLQIVEAAEKAKKPLSICTGAFNRQFGLPCAHTIAGLARANAQIELGHLNRHWWLKRDRVSQLLRLFI